jgi:hypothetical protein
MNLSTRDIHVKSRESSEMLIGMGIEHHCFILQNSVLHDNTVKKGESLRNDSLAKAFLGHNNRHGFYSNPIILGNHKTTSGKKVISRRTKI